MIYHMFKLLFCVGGPHYPATSSIEGDTSEASRNKLILLIVIEKNDNCF